MARGIDSVAAGNTSIEPWKPLPGLMLEKNCLNCQIVPYKTKEQSFGSLIEDAQLIEKKEEKEKDKKQQSIDKLIKFYQKLVKDKKKDRSHVSLIADTFLKLVKLSLETIGPDPETGDNYLFTLSYFQEDLMSHFKTSEALDILREKAAKIEVDEYPKQSIIAPQDHEALKKLQREIEKEKEKVNPDEIIMKMICCEI